MENQIYIRSHWGRGGGLQNNISWGRAYLGQQMAQLAKEYAIANGFEYSESGLLCYMNDVNRSPTADEGRVFWDELVIYAASIGAEISGRDCIIEAVKQRI